MQVISFVHGKIGPGVEAASEDVMRDLDRGESEDAPRTKIELDSK